MLTAIDLFSGAGGFGVPNGIYPCWCVQDHVPKDLHNQPATLYSTIGGSLPGDVAGLPWAKINYVLNNKIRVPGETNLKFFEDVQTAIWKLLGGDPNPDFGVDANAQKMINQGNAHPSFIPDVDDVVAVIVWSNPLKHIQRSICEMKPPQYIVNKATASGKSGSQVVQSNQVSATVSQTF